MDALWQAWLEYYKTEIYDDIDKPYRSEVCFEPVDEADIAECEQMTKLKIPEDLKTIYQYTSKGFGLFFGETLYSPKQMIEYHQQWVGLGYIDTPDNDQVDNPAYPPNTVRPVYINQYWLPFAGEVDNRNYWAIDYDPLADGKVGQIINAGRESNWELRFSFQGDITAFARIIMQRIEAGKTAINAEGKLLICKASIQSNHCITELLKKGEFR
jgi:cell wall assembly regulator SMI1